MTEATAGAVAANQSLNIQAHIRRNAIEQNSILKDFVSWEDDIKQRDVQLQSTSYKSQQYGYGSNESRGDVFTEVTHSNNGISQLDDYSTMMEGNSQLKEGCGKSGEITYAESIEEEERIKGNQHYANGKFQEAIKAYTRCIQINSNSCVAFSNRAMCYLKLKDWIKAENDATFAIEIDDLHVKSYQRRSAARLALGKLRSSLRDLHLAQMVISSSSDGNDGHNTGLSLVDSQSPQYRQIEVEKKKVQTALLAAMKRAPKHEVKIEIVRSRKTKKKEDGHQQQVEKERQTNEKQSLNRISSKNCQQQLSNIETIKNIKTWVQFEQMWKSLDDEKDRILLLSKFKPEQITNFYRNGIEDSDLLLDLLQCIAQISSNVRIDFVRAIGAIPSLDMIVMMMSPKKQVIARAVLEEILNKEGDKIGKEDMNTIIAQFGLGM